MELWLRRNDCVPMSHVHVMVWGCSCFKLWAIEAKTVIQNMPFSASLVLGGDSVLESLSVCLLVPPVFSLGLKPAVASSLLIITHCFSMQRACLWVVESSDLQERGACCISKTDLPKRLLFTSKKKKTPKTKKPGFIFIFATLGFFFFSPCVSFRHLFIHDQPQSFCSQGES